MQFTPVISSNINGFSYDAAGQNMLVRFHNGGVYRYDGVTPDTATSVMTAQSPGKAVRSFLSNGTKLTPEEMEKINATPPV